VVDPFEVGIVFFEVIANDIGMAMPGFNFDVEVRHCQK
jgi:hypothetical protein